MLILHTYSSIAIRSLLVYSLLIVCFKSYAQPRDVKYSFDGPTNNLISPLSPVQKVDSIAETNGMARYFAKEYSESMKKIESQIENFDSTAQVFIRVFEN